MEKRVLFTELDDRGSHLRKEITPTAVVTDKRRFPTAQFWDANKTYDVIVADATSASDTLEKAEKNLNNEIARAQRAENALSDKIDDLLGIDAEDIEDLKQLVEDLDPETGILSVIEQKANSADLATVATSGSYNDLLDKPDLSLKANVEDISVITIGDPNGHDYVDLGLPSGTLWATMNVGANSETAYGNYYEYGKTTPHKFPEDPQYTGKEDPLDLSADVAHVIWGGGWHIPTKEQFEELIENTNYSWETISGSNIAKFTSKTDSSKYIYLPAAGYKSGPSTYWAGNACFCWASNPYNNPDYPSLYQAYNFIASSDDIKVNQQNVSIGYPIRPVLDAQKILGKTVTDAEKAAWNAKLDTQEQADWNEADNTKVDYIKNKPDLSLKANTSDLNQLIDDISAPAMNANGHSYVDLGLPSNTLWATMNIGASGEYSYGSYYMYGKTTTYNSSDSIYTGTENPLSLSADAARQIWGGDWYIPTKADFEELIANTTYYRDTSNGITYIRFTSKNNGNEIIIPCGGKYFNGSSDQVGKCCNYWTSTIESNKPYFLYSLSSNLYIMLTAAGTDNRDIGYNVRPVIKGPAKILGTTITAAERTAWNAKANTSDYYTKAEIDAMLQLITNA